MVISSPNGQMAAKLHLPHSGQTAPLVIFAHGFKGFMDWGHFGAIGQVFAQAGFAFLRFNFTHNGTTLAQPDAFANLDAFGQNTYTKELQDLLAVIDHAATGQAAPRIDATRISLLGHSRGGAIALLAAQRYPAVHKVVTWNGVSTLLRFSQEQMAEWQQRGILHIHNSRTGQLMPLYTDLLEDVRRYHREYQPARVARSLQQPYLQVQGTADATVPLSEAQNMRVFNYQMKWVDIEGGDHTFGGKHPWTEPDLPDHTLQAIEATLAFLR